MARCRIVLVLRKSPHEGRQPERYVRRGKPEDVDVAFRTTGGGGTPTLVVTTSVGIMPASAAATSAAAPAGLTFVFGREPAGCHAVVSYKSAQGPLLSRRHCFLAATINDRDGPQLWLHDAGSLNGSFVSRRRVPKGGSLPLRLGSTIAFGAGASIQVAPADAGPNDVLGPGGEVYVLPEASVSFEWVVQEMQWISDAPSVAPTPAPASLVEVADTPASLEDEILIAPSAAGARQSLAVLSSIGGGAAPQLDATRNVGAASAASTVDDSLGALLAKSNAGTQINTNHPGGTTETVDTPQPQRPMSRGVHEPFVPQRPVPVLPSDRDRSATLASLSAQPRPAPASAPLMPPSGAKAPPQAPPSLLRPASAARLPPFDAPLPPHLVPRGSASVSALLGLVNDGIAAATASGSALPPPPQPALPTEAPEATPPVVPSSAGAAGRLSSGAALPSAVASARSGTQLPGPSYGFSRVEDDAADLVPDASPAAGQAEEEEDAVAEGVAPAEAMGDAQTSANPAGAVPTPAVATPAPPFNYGAPKADDGVADGVADHDVVMLPVIRRSGRRDTQGETPPPRIVQRAPVPSTTGVAQESVAAELEEREAVLPLSARDDGYDAEAAGEAGPPSPLDVAATPAQKKKQAADAKAAKSAATKKAGSGGSRAKKQRGFDVSKVLADFLADADEGRLELDSQELREERLEERANKAAKQVATMQRRKLSLAALRGSDDAELLAGLSTDALEALASFQVAPAAAETTTEVTPGEENSDSRGEEEEALKRHRGERPPPSDEASHVPSSQGLGEADNDVDNGDDRVFESEQMLFDERRVHAGDDDAASAGISPGRVAGTTTAMSAEDASMPPPAAKAVTFSLPAMRSTLLVPARHESVVAITADVPPGDDASAIQVPVASQSNANGWSQWQVATQESLGGGGSMGNFGRLSAVLPRRSTSPPSAQKAQAAAEPAAASQPDAPFHSQLPITSSTGWRAHRHSRQHRVSTGGTAAVAAATTAAGDADEWPVPQFASQRELPELPEEVLPAAIRAPVRGLSAAEIAIAVPAKDTAEDEGEKKPKGGTKQSASAKAKAAQKRQNALLDEDDDFVPMPRPRGEGAAGALAAESKAVRSTVGQLLAAIDVDGLLTDVAATLPSPHSPSFRPNTNSATARIVNPGQPTACFIPLRVFELLRPHQLAALRFIWRVVMAPETAGGTSLSKGANAAAAAELEPPRGALARAFQARGGGDAASPTSAQPKRPTTLQLLLGDGVDDESEDMRPPAFNPTKRAPAAAGAADREQPIGCIVAHSMGLGKSFTAIAFVFTLWHHLEYDLPPAQLAQRAPARVLVVVPKGVLMHWVSEVMGWGEACEEAAAHVFCLASDGSAARLALVHDWADAAGQRSLLLMSASAFTRIMGSGESVGEAAGGPAAPLNVTDLRPKKGAKGRAGAKSKGAATTKRKSRADEGADALADAMPADAGDDAQASSSDDDDAEADATRAAGGRAAATQAGYRAVRATVLAACTHIILDEAHKVHTSQHGLRKALAALPSSCKRVLLTGTPGTGVPVASESGDGGATGTCALSPFGSMLQLVHPTLWARRDLTREGVESQIQAVTQRCSIRAIAHELPPAAIVTVHVALSQVQRRAFDGLIKAHDPTKPVVAQKQLLGLSSKAAMVSQHPVIAAEWAKARGATPQHAVESFRASMAAGRHNTSAANQPPKLPDAAAAWALPTLLVDGPPEYESLTHAPKAKVAMHIIRRAMQEGERVVVFSASTRVLLLLAHYMVEFGLQAQRDFVLVDGTVRAAARQAVCDEFNAAAVEAADGSTSQGSASASPLRVVLAASRSCGVGMSFVGASRVILFEPHWTAAAEAQTIGRVVRFGQTRPTTVVRLVSDTSFELRMLRASASDAARRLTSRWGDHPLAKPPTAKQLRGGAFGEPVTKKELLAHRSPLATTSDEFDAALSSTGVTQLVESGIDSGSVVADSLAECEDVIAGIVVEPNALDSLTRVGRAPES